MIANICYSLSLSFLTLSILVLVKWYFIVALICISLVSTDVEHLCHVLVDHFYIFLWGISIQISHPFLIWITYLFIIEL